VRGDVGEFPRDRLPPPPPRFDIGLRPNGQSNFLVRRLGLEVDENGRIDEGVHVFVSAVQKQTVKSEAYWDGSILATNVAANVLSGEAVRRRMTSPVAERNKFKFPISPDR